MAGESMAERTEHATPRRLEDAFNDGKIARSQELTIAGSLVASAAVISALAPATGNALSSMMGHSLTNIATIDLNVESAQMLLRDTMTRGFSAVLAMLVALGAGSFALAAIQARGVFSLKPITPQLSRINPLSNARNLLGSRQVVELGKSFGKLAIVGGAVYTSIKSALPEAISLSEKSQLGFLYVVQHHIVRLLSTAGVAYLALAAGDYVWQWWQFQKQMRMTKQEVKEESKQNDGDPHIKQRRRMVARGYARRQMMRDVPKADVVIVNPTHIAIAIKYDPTVAPAPFVLAIGQRKIAERIKQIARESGVPMVENKPLARALLKSAKVGSLIPYELYMAVAEVLAFVLRARRARGNWAGSAIA